MPGDGFTIKSRIKNLLRSQSTKNKKKSKENLTRKLTLEKVLGITTSGNSSLTCDPKSGLIAYPAGCVVVLLDPRNNKQNHIINTSRKTITALAFSPDGKYLVTGESGHLPAVRLWDVAERRHVAELQKHKYGVSCVAFSPNNKYIVSVGNQHDMMVNVWAWKMDVVVAANKVSSKVTAVSFSEGRSYFVTVGNRHVKFWYLDHCKASKTSAPVPLLGRVGLLGELRNNFFCDVACGRGSNCDSTFCVTSSGLLCELNKSRMLDKWVDLQTSMAQSISLSEDMVFCGCADGIVRVFSPSLRFVGTLPRPLALGADVSSHVCSTKANSHYPDVIGVAYDSAHRWLSCVYNDHSLYVWDVRDVLRAGKLNSALFHAACVWDLQMFPDVVGEPLSGLSSGAFLTCSADSTVRLWCTEELTQTHKNSQNALSKDLLNIIYTNGSTGALLDPECSANVNADKSVNAEPRTGIRTISVSPDGKHLASGDRSGMLRIHDLSSMEEILKVEAHDAEILCLEYSKPETGLKLLASASRDRLIHVLDASSSYSLVQTLDQHSSSITAVRFAANENKVSMISCGADKSIYFHTAHQSDRGTEFWRSHHMVRKTTLYDMSVDATCKYAAVGCQDRCIRIFNISSGKQKKVYKGSVSEDGILLKVQIDPSGQYVATSCSDKNISIFDFYSGECVATAFGHSEIITGMKFTNDCKYLITVSGDSCIFIWKLAPELTFTMKERLHQLQRNPNSPPFRSSAFRREVHSAPVLGSLSSSHHHHHLMQEDREEEVEDSSDHDDSSSSSPSDNSHEDEDAGSWDDGQKLEKGGAGVQVIPDAPKRPRRRWSHRIGSLELMVKSMLDLRQLETFGQKKTTNWLDKDKPITSSLQDSMEQVEERSRRRWPRLSSPRDAAALFPEESELSDGEYPVRERRGSSLERELLSQDGCSPDSACSLGYDSRESMPDCSPDWGPRPLGKPDPCSYEESRNRSSSEEEEEDEGKKLEAVTSLDEALRRVNADHSQQDFLKENYETLGESCSTELTCAQRVSISSRFLSRGRHDRRVPLFAKMTAKKPKPPLLKVQTTVEDQSRTKDPGSESTGRTEGERDGPAKLRTSRKSSGSHLWRRSTPVCKEPLDSNPSLQKSHSAQNLASNPLGSPAPPGAQRESRIKPQQLWLSEENLKPSFHVSSPSSGSPGSPGSPQPWESPKSSTHYSYMNPTISSLAKSSRSLSLGDDLQSVTPPRSPCSCESRRRSSDMEMEPALFSSSPFTTSVSSAPSLPPSPPSSSPPQNRPAASPVRLKTPPSRIPLLKQPLSPGHLYKMKPSSSWCGPAGGASSPPADAGYHVPPSPEKLKVCSRQLSLGLDLVFPSSLPVREKRKSLPESRREGDEKQRPLVAEDVFSTSPQPDSAVSVETCRRIAADLQRSLQKTIALFTTQLPRRNHCLREEQQEMRDILTEALLSVKAQLDSLPLLKPPYEGAEG